MTAAIQLKFRMFRSILQNTPSTLNMLIAERLSVNSNDIFLVSSFFPSH